MNDYNAMSEANAISDLERAEHLNYSGGKGVKRVSVFNDGVQVNVATNDAVSSLYAVKVTAVGSITYVGEAAIGSSQGSAVWRCKKVDQTSGTVITWANGGAFSNVATDLTALSYA